MWTMLKQLMVLVVLLYILSIVLEVKHYISRGGRYTYVQ